jgi:hypothetical protein
LRNSQALPQAEHVSGGLSTWIVLPQLLHFQYVSGRTGFLSAICSSPFSVAGPWQKKTIYLLTVAHHLYHFYGNKIRLIFELSRRDMGRGAR